jgi:hypothetical protein
MPDISRSVVHRIQVDRLTRNSVFSVFEEKQAYRCCVPAENRKLGSVIVKVNPERKGVSGKDLVGLGAPL